MFTEVPDPHLMPQPQDKAFLELIYQLIQWLTLNKDYKD